jgi:hypothetical protein
MNNSKSIDEVLENMNNSKLIDETLENMKLIRRKIWDFDVPHPTTNEYREFHEKMQSILKDVDGLIEDLDAKTSESRMGKPVKIRKIEVDWNHNEIISFEDIIETIYHPIDERFIKMNDDGEDIEYTGIEELHPIATSKHEYRIFAREVTEYYMIEED